MDKLIRNSTTEFLIFTSQNKEDSIEVKVFEESVWLTQTMIAQLFDTAKQNISLHFKNIFENNELEENSVVKNFLTTATDGKNYQKKYYNLDAIISVGYRVNSKKATQFRQWATRLDKFLDADDREILKDSGKITKKIADEKAISEFEKYRVIQDKEYLSDFDKLLLKMENKK